MEYILIRIREDSIWMSENENAEDVEVHYIVHGDLNYILDCVRQMLYHVRLDSEDEFLGNYIHVENGNLEDKGSKFVRLREIYRSSDHNTYSTYDYLIAPINNHCICIW